MAVAVMLCRLMVAHLVAGAHMGMHIPGRKACFTKIYIWSADMIGTHQQICTMRDRLPLIQI